MHNRLFRLTVAMLLALCTLLTGIAPAVAAPAVPAVPVVASAMVAPGTGSSQSSLDTAAAAARGERWIEIILSQRRLIAREGNKVVLSTIVSIGKPSTPTVRGTFRIYAKMRSTRMTGPGYSVPNVPYVMFFRGGYSIHGAPWVGTFGGMISHGCVNVPVAKAAWLFNWAPAGTRVVIR